MGFELKSLTRGALGVLAATFGASAIGEGPFWFAIPLIIGIGAEGRVAVVDGDTAIGERPFWFSIPFVRSIGVEEGAAIVGGDTTLGVCAIGTCEMLAKFCGGLRTGLALSTAVAYRFCS